MKAKKHKECTLWWCHREHYAKGYCHTHWTAVKRYGSPYGRHANEYERIDDIIERTRKFAWFTLHSFSDTTDEDTLTEMAKQLLSETGGDYVDGT